MGTKKGSFTAKNLSEKSAVQTGQPVWDLLEIVIQRDDFSSETVSNGPRPEPSAARVGAEADPPRDMVAEVEIGVCEEEDEWWSENEGHCNRTPDPF